MGKKSGTDVDVTIRERLPCVGPLDSDRKLNQ